MELNYKDLEVWKQFFARIYLLFYVLAAKEMFGLQSQKSRAVISVFSNIAERASRKSNKELVQFLYV